jgi:Glycosyltransferase family 17
MPLFVVDQLRRRLVRLWVALGVGVCLIGQLRVRDDEPSPFFFPAETDLRGGTGGSGSRGGVRTSSSSSSILFFLSGSAAGDTTSSSSSSKAAGAMEDPRAWWDARSYPTPGHVRTGLLSRKPFGYFQARRDVMDGGAHSERCARHGFVYKNRTAPRRIFYGAMIANEPWELFEVAGAEAYGLFSGAVFVEGNRTQNFTPRNASRLEHGPHLARIFGVASGQVQVRLYANENRTAFDGDYDSFLSREHAQRQEALAGWKDLGMRPDDLGYLGDSDEIFTRDFYLALQHCDGIRHLDYDSGRCKYSETGLKSTTLNFEGSPDCPTHDRWGYRPDIFLGHCIEGIGDEALHPKAPRPYEGSMDRAEGFGRPGSGSRAGEDNITDGRYPLLNAADMRRIGGAVMVQRRQPGFSVYTAYHFHNFFAGADAIRHKYRTYGHSRDTDFRYKLSDLDADLDLMVRCVHNNNTNPNRPGYYEFVEGGLLKMLPPYPVYFLDDDYRRARHELVTSMVLADEREWRQHNSAGIAETAAADSA